MKSIRPLQRSGGLLFVRNISSAPAKDSVPNLARLHRTHYKLKPFLQNESVALTELRFVDYMLKRFTDDKTGSFVELAIQAKNERRGRQLTETDFIEGANRLNYGTIIQKSHHDFARTVAHEAGHLLVSVLLGELVSYAEVVIRTKGSAGMVATHYADPQHMTPQDALNYICVGLAGLESEKIHGQADPARAVGDRTRATVMAIRVEQNNFSGNDLDPVVSDQAKSILREQAARAHQLLTRHAALRSSYMETLFRRKKLYHDEIIELANRHQLPAPSSLKKRS